MRDITEVMQILKDIRRNKTISVQQVADYIYEEVGTQISAKTVYGRENASSKPDIAYFIAMCNLYQIRDIQELFTEDSKLMGIDITARDELYKAYAARPDMQEAVHILLGMV